MLSAQATTACRLSASPTAIHFTTLTTAVMNTPASDPVDSRATTTLDSASKPTPVLDAKSFTIKNRMHGRRVTATKTVSVHAFRLAASSRLCRIRQSVR
jgi:hypothetical protein